jgi:hypothetical protein
MKYRKQSFSAFNTIASLIIVFILFSLGVYYFNQPKQSVNPNDPIQPYVYEFDSYPARPQVQTPPDLRIGIQDKSTDTIRNPYAPPVKYHNADYNQLGYLSAGAYKLPLLGKPASNMSRDKWYYYTIQNGIKIPVCKGRRKCSVSPGCDSVSNGDVVLVDESEFIVQMYDTDMM